MKKLSIEGYLDFVSPLFIAAGATTPDADKSTVMYGQRPFVPGSSLKGRVRAQCTRLVAGLGGDACHVSDLEPCDCAVCAVFGNRLQPSPLRFSDWMLASPDKAPGDWEAWDKTTLRFGVAINRERRTAGNEKLFVLRTGTPGLSQALWYGRITGYLGEERYAGLLVAGLLSLDSIGGGNSRGLGWLQSDWIGSLVVQWGKDTVPNLRPWLEKALSSFETPTTTGGEAPCRA